MTIIASNYRTIEIVINNTSIGNTITFPQNNEIDGTIIDSIETFDNSILFASPETNTEVVSYTQGADIVFTLYEQSTAKFYSIPYNSFNTPQNAGILRELQNLKINLRECSITIVGNSAIVAGKAVVFNFIFRRDKVNTK